MENSYNLLRAELTPKYIEVPELIAKTIFCNKVTEDLLFKPQVHDCWKNHVVPVSDFKFSGADKAEDISIEANSAEIVFAVETHVTLSHEDGSTITINKGFILAWYRK